MLVVDPAALVLFGQTDFRGLVGLTVEIHNVLGPEGLVGAYIDVDGIRTILQDVVGIAAYDDAGALFRQVENHIALGVPQVICRGKAVHNARHALGGKGIGEHAAAGRMLGMLRYKLGRKTGLFGNIFNEFTVIERNPQLIRHHMSDGPSAGTELTADRNDFLFHNIASKKCFLMVPL